MAQPAIATPALELAPTTDAPPYSPEWWVTQLERQLGARKPLVDLYESYYAGRFRLNFASSPFREAFGQMLAAVSDNWMPLVVQAPVERLTVQGIRLGQGKRADKQGWEIWQRNYLDHDSRLLFLEAGKHGEAYLLVWWDQDTADVRARITVEHPSQMIVARKAGDRRRRVAALKKWQEDDGTLMATLYLPDTIHRFQYFKAPKTPGWKPRARVEHSEDNPLGVVPVIPVVSDPQMMPALPPTGMLGAPQASIGLGRSDLVDVISTQDQLNKILCDLMVASEYAAFRQRWVTGVELEDDKDGLEISIDRLLHVGAPDARFGDFDATDLGNYIKAYESRLQSLAARSRTPPHYLLGHSGSFPSGESLKSAETGLVKRTDDKKTSYGESIEEADRLALQIETGKVRPRAEGAECDWAHSESRSEAEFADSLVKKLAIGVPFQQLWADWGYSPQQIDQFKVMLREVAIRDLRAGARPAALEPGEDGDDPHEDPPPDPPAS